MANKKPFNGQALKFHQVNKVILFLFEKQKLECCDVSSVVTGKTGVDVPWVLLMFGFWRG